MVQVTPNLHFNGECKQAVKLYQEAFGAQIRVLLCESDADPKDWTATDDTKDLVYHGELMIGGQTCLCGFVSRRYHCSADASDYL